MAKKETEDENKALKEAERFAKEQAKKEAEEAKRAKEAEFRSKKEAEAAEKKAKKEAERLAKEQVKQAKKEAPRDISSVPAEGNFQLVLPSSMGFKQLKLFTDQLASIKDLKIVWTGGSIDEGILIAVSVTQALPLAQILSEMPMVDGVEVKGEKITVTPKVSV